MPTEFRTFVIFCTVCSYYMLSGVFSIYTRGRIESGSLGDARREVQEQTPVRGPPGGQLPEAETLL